MCNATVNRFGLGLGSDRREWCCWCRRKWFGAVANGSHRRDWVWVQIVVANGSEPSSQMVRSLRREWFRPPSRMVRSRRREWFRPSRMVQTAVRRREWFGAVANGSDRRREWFGAVANGSDRRE